MPDLSKPPRLDQLDTASAVRIWNDTGIRLAAAALGSNRELGGLREAGLAGFFPETPDRTWIHSLFGGTSADLWNASEFRSEKELSKRVGAVSQQFRDREGKPEKTNWKLNEFFAQSLTSKLSLAAPDHYWLLCTHYAWENGRFELHLKERMTSYLLKNHILHPFPSGGFNIRIQPETIGVLLIMACGIDTKRDSSRWRRLKVFLLNLFRKKLPAGDLQNALYRIVSRRQQWAGFWDQWLLDQAIRRWPLGPAHVYPAGFRIQLVGLPYARARIEALNVPVKKKTPPSLWWDPDWTQTMPECLGIFPNES